MARVAGADEGRASADVRRSFDFTGRAVCITGGAQGIGAAVCESFAALGASVAVADIDAEGAQERAEELAGTYGVETLALEVDVSAYQDAGAMVERTTEAFGSLDVLVNNAGVAMPEPFTETEPADWDDQLDVSLYGTLNCTHAALAHMTERGEGVIVNYASSSHRGNDPGLSVYGAAKAANRSFTKTVAREVGEDGVRVNCVSPGTVETPATAAFVEKYREGIVDSYASDRVGQPGDVANAVVFLASDAAEWITGETLHVDGGYLRR